MKKITFCMAMLIASPVFPASLVVLDDFDVSWGGGDQVTMGFSYQQSTEYATSDALYLHDDGGLLRSTIRSVEGLRFDAVAANALAYSNLYQTGAGPRPTSPGERDAWLHASKPVFDNYGVFGYRREELVAEVTGWMDGGYGEYARLGFGEDFRDIDMLELRYFNPNAPVHFYPEIKTSSTQWCLEWCGGFQIDNLTLRVEGDPPAPVPAPGAAILLLSAVGGAVALRARSRRRRSRDA